MGGIKIQDSSFGVNDDNSIPDSFIISDGTYGGTYVKTSDKEGTSGLPIYTNGTYCLAMNVNQVVTLFNASDKADAMNGIDSSFISTKALDYTNDYVHGLRGTPFTFNSGLQTQSGLGLSTEVRYFSESENDQIALYNYTKAMVDSGRINDNDMLGGVAYTDDPSQLEACKASILGERKKYLVTEWIDVYNSGTDPNSGTHNMNLVIPLIDDNVCNDNGYVYTDKVIFQDSLYRDWELINENRSLHIERFKHGYSSYYYWFYTIGNISITVSNKSSDFFLNGWITLDDLPYDVSVTFRDRNGNGYLHGNVTTISIREY